MLSNVEPLLVVSGVTERFGGIGALDAISFDLAQSHVCGLIGPNDTGKITLFDRHSRLCNCIAFVGPTGFSVLLSPSLLVGFVVGGLASIPAWSLARSSCS